ncbi:uncharacterized protein LOC131928623 [Physella acuta]|uniref:uncharacterized protein LOC131928623 n=1 Tax=Physella acuta TaxID=109671 RepID=UPI0027DB31BF|nr:uncharacterized protein LOC131928623 [Physella acuta]
MSTLSPQSQRTITPIENPDDTGPATPTKRKDNSSMIEVQKYDLASSNESDTFPTRDQDTTTPTKHDTASYRSTKADEHNSLHDSHNENETRGHGYTRNDDVISLQNINSLHTKSDVEFIKAHNDQDSIEADAHRSDEDNGFYSDESKTKPKTYESEEDDFYDDSGHKNSLGFTPLYKEHQLQADGSSDGRNASMAINEEQGIDFDSGSRFDTGENLDTKQSLQQNEKSDIHIDFEEDTVGTNNDGISTRENLNENNTTTTDYKKDQVDNQNKEDVSGDVSHYRDMTPEHRKQKDQEDSRNSELFPSTLSLKATDNQTDKELQDGIQSTGDSQNEPNKNLEFGTENLNGELNLDDSVESSYFAMFKKTSELEDQPDKKSEKQNQTHEKSSKILDNNDKTSGKSGEQEVGLDVKKTVVANSETNMNKKPEESNSRHDSAGGDTKNEKFRHLDDKDDRENKKYLYYLNNDVSEPDDQNIDRGTPEKLFSRTHSTRDDARPENLMIDLNTEHDYDQYSNQRVRYTYALKPGTSPRKPGTPGYGETKAIDRLMHGPYSISQKVTHKVSPRKPAQGSRSKPQVVKHSKTQKKDGGEKGAGELHEKSGRNKKVKGQILDPVSRKDEKEEKQNLTQDKTSTGTRNEKMDGELSQADKDSGETLLLKEDNTSGNINNVEVVAELEGGQHTKSTEQDLTHTAQANTVDVHTKPDEKLNAKPNKKHDEKVDEKNVVGSKGTSAVQQKGIFNILKRDTKNKKVDQEQNTPIEKTDITKKEAEATLSNKEGETKNSQQEKETTINKENGIALKVLARSLSKQDGEETVPKTNGNLPNGNLDSPSLVRIEQEKTKNATKGKEKSKPQKQAEQPTTKTKPAEKKLASVRKWFGGKTSSPSTKSSEKTGSKYVPAAATTTPPTARSVNGIVITTEQEEKAGTTVEKGTDPNSKPKDSKSETKQGETEETTTLTVVDETTSDVQSSVGNVVLANIKRKLKDKTLSSSNTSLPVHGLSRSPSPETSFGSAGSKFGKAAHKTQSMSSLKVPGLSPREHTLDEDNFSMSSRRDSARHSLDSASRKSVDYRIRNATTAVQPFAEEKPKSVLTNDENFIMNAIPYLPLSLAIICLFLNIVLPGSGTALSGLSILCCGQARISNKSDQIFTTLCANCMVGLAQLFTVTFMLVGWFWSIGWGIQMVSLSVQHREEMKQQRTKELQALALSAFGSPKRGAGPFGT